MSINERIYKIDQLLTSKRSVSFQEMLERLEVSRATLKRDLSYMRDRLNAPIIFDKDLGGYRLEKQGPGIQYLPDNPERNCPVILANSFLSGYQYS